MRSGSLVRCECHLPAISPAGSRTETDARTGFGSIWAAMSGVWCIVLPLWESRVEIGIILRGMLGQGAQERA